MKPKPTEIEIMYDNAKSYLIRLSKGKIDETRCHDIATDLAMQIKKKLDAGWSARISVGDYLLGACKYSLKKGHVPPYAQEAFEDNTLSLAPDINVGTKKDIEGEWDTVKSISRAIGG